MAQWQEKLLKAMTRTNRTMASFEKKLTDAMLFIKRKMDIDFEIAHVQKVLTKGGEKKRYRVCQSLKPRLAAISMADERLSQYSGDSGRMNLIPENKLCICIFDAPNVKSNGGNNAVGWQSFSLQIH
ncbi:hypothetical protein EJB05_53217 [Eragrostis curvula]|uniref:Uncharacterized protein n=1 Tax=Eragrostis curvula TaxID=38414 RepID=A0A5J9SQX0_9POAL|nr:hypothetical protein EJB05_53217 [Eragrostis curvula]